MAAFQLPPNANERLTTSQLKSRVRNRKRHYWEIVIKMDALELQLDANPTYKTLEQLGQLWYKLQDVFHNFRTSYQVLPAHEKFGGDKLKRLVNSFKYWKGLFEGDKLDQWYMAMTVDLKAEFEAITGSEATYRNAAKVGYIYGLCCSYFSNTVGGASGPLSPKEEAGAWDSLVYDCKNHYDSASFKHKRPFVQDWADSIYQYKDLEHNKSYKFTIQEAHAFADDVHDYEANFVANLKECHS